MLQNQIRITQINDRYVVETQDGRTHILNLSSLKWNLKRVFGFTGVEVLTVVTMLEHGKYLDIDLSQNEQKVAA